MATLSQYGTGQQQVATPNAATGGIGGYTPQAKKTKDLSGTINSILGNVSNIAGSIAGQLETEKREQLQLNVNTAQSIGLKHSRQLNQKMQEINQQVLDNKVDRLSAMKQLNDYNMEISLKGQEGLSLEAKEAYERTYVNPSIQRINSQSTVWAKEQIKLDQELVFKDTEKAINELGSSITTEELKALRQGLVNVGLDDSKVESASFSVMKSELEGKYGINPASYYTDGKKFYTDEETKKMAYASFTPLLSTTNKNIKGAIDKTVGAILKDKKTYINKVLKPSKEDYYRIKAKLDNAKTKTGAAGTNIDLNKVLSPQEQQIINSFTPSQRNTIGNLKSDILGNTQARNLVNKNASVLYSGNLTKDKTNLFKNVLVNGKVVNRPDGTSFKITTELANAELKKVQERADNQFASIQTEMNNNTLGQYAVYAQANKEINKPSVYTNKINDRMTTNNFAAYNTAEEIINESNMYKINSTISKTNEKYSIFLASKLKQTYDATKQDLLSNPKYSDNGELNAEGKKSLLNQVISAKTSVIKSVFNNKYISKVSSWSIASTEDLKTNWINEEVSSETLDVLNEHIIRKAIKLDNQENYTDYAKNKLVSTRGFFSNLSSVLPFTDTNYMVLAPEGTNENEIIDASDYFVKNVLKADDIDDYSFSNEIADNGDILVVLNRKAQDGETDRTYKLDKEDIVNLASKEMQTGWASTVRKKLRIKD